jgi:hypothetical protein
MGVVASAKTFVHRRPLGDTGGRLTHDIRSRAWERRIHESGI